MIRFFTTFFDEMTLKYQYLNKDIRILISKRNFVLNKNDKNYIYYWSNENKISNEHYQYVDEQLDPCKMNKKDCRVTIATPSQVNEHLTFIQQSCCPTNRLTKVERSNRKRLG